MTSLEDIPLDLILHAKKSFDGVMKLCLFLQLLHIFNDYVFWVVIFTKLKERQNVEFNSSEL